MCILVHRAFRVLINNLFDEPSYAWQISPMTKTYQYFILLIMDIILCNNRLYILLQSKKQNWAKTRLLKIIFNPSFIRLSKVDSMVCFSWRPSSTTSFCFPCRLTPNFLMYFYLHLYWPIKKNAVLFYNSEAPRNLSTCKKSKP